MLWKDYFDIAYKVISSLAMLGILGGVGRLVVWAIRFGPRFEALETQNNQYGPMVQQIVARIAHIEGWIGGRDGGYTKGGGA